MLKGIYTYIKLSIKGRKLKKLENISCPKSYTVLRDLIATISNDYENDWFLELLWLHWKLKKISDYLTPKRFLYRDCKKAVCQTKKKVQQRAA